MYGYASACDDYIVKHYYLTALLERKQVEDGYVIMWTFFFHRKALVSLPLRNEFTMLACA